MKNLESMIGKSSPVSGRQGGNVQEGQLEYFVPEHISAYIKKKQGRINVPAVQYFKSVAVFIDVSGFTALTEMLADNSENGVEQLGFYLNRYFERIVKMLNGSGGDVIKFAGDALITLWQPAYKKGNSGEEELDLENMCCRAAQCALEIQEELHGAELAKNVCFSVKVGIGCEMVTMMHLGGLCKRAEYTLCGQALLDAFDCEALCKPGDTIVSPQVWDFIKNNFNGEEIKRKDSIQLDPKSSMKKFTDKNVNEWKLRGKKGSISFFRGLRQGRSLERFPSDEKFMNGSIRVSSKAPLERRSSFALKAGKSFHKTNLPKKGTCSSLTLESSEREKVQDRVEIVEIGKHCKSNAYVKLLRNRRRLKKISVRKTLLQHELEIEALKLYVPAAVKPFLDQQMSSWYILLFYMYRASEVRTAAVCFVNLNLEVLKALAEVFRERSMNDMFSSGFVEAFESSIPNRFLNDLVKIYFERAMARVLRKRGLKKVQRRKIRDSFKVAHTEKRIKKILKSVQETFVIVQKIVYGLEGSINKFLIDDKGSTLLVVFGLSPLTHYNDPARAMFFALQAVHELKILRLNNIITEALDYFLAGFPIKVLLQYCNEKLGYNLFDEGTLESLILKHLQLNECKHSKTLYKEAQQGLERITRLLAEEKFRGKVCYIGLTSGEALSGPVGSGSRREYSILGDVVNTSARLMQAASKLSMKKNMQFTGCILCSEEVRSSVSVVDSTLVFETLPPIKLKGKVELVKIFQPAYSKGYLIKRKAETLLSIEMPSKLTSGIYLQEHSSPMVTTYSSRFDLTILYYLDIYLLQIYGVKKTSGTVSTIGLIGNSGAGKSFFLDLLDGTLKSKYGAIPAKNGFQEVGRAESYSFKGLSTKFFIVSASGSVEMMKQVKFFIFSKSAPICLCLARCYIPGSKPFT
eukprot:snap_masked-scaffold_43-processed-gene-1.101-mRNA-1 protein AED:0.19 eAED:0.31 QI:0/-1/0/1/-1/1/1/0/917